METVRTQQVDVSREQVGHQRVHGHAALDAHGAGDDVAVLRGRHVRLADQPSLELLLDQGVVLGELVRAVLAEQVGAAVADVRDDGVAPADEQRDQGGPHSAPARIGERDGIDVGARSLHRPLHRLRGALARFGGGRAREGVQHRLLTGQRVAQRLHRGRAGDLAGRMAAHPVGYRVEPERLVDQVGILVVGALLADVGARPAPDDRHGARTLA